MATVERPTSTPTPHEALEHAPAASRVPMREDLYRGGEAGTRWKFTVDEYYRMAEAGIFRPHDRVELIDGDIIVMSPIGSPHGSVSKRLITLLVNTFGTRAIVAAGDPVRLDDRSEPEPDLSVLRPRDDFYKATHPTPADVYLIIEVMDSSAPYDRGRKLARYARSGLVEVWLVDIGRERIEVHRRPNGEDYDEKRTLARGQTLAPEAFPDSVLDVDAILG
jgi:Uma2 family endonuclease